MDIQPDVFDGITAPPVAELVVEQIEVLILNGILTDGVRLPSERDLSARLNVSRPMVRAALQTLAANGLLEIRHGEGTFVAQLTGQAMQRPLIDLYARQGRAFDDYLEYRRAQEGFAARLAAERATEYDRTEIVGLYEKLEDCEDRGDEELSRATDVEFHVSILNASHNSMLVHMMASIYDLTRRGVFYNRKFLRTLDGTGRKLLAQHKDIADAVVDGEPGKAEDAARAHLDFVAESFRVGRAAQAYEEASRKRTLAQSV